MTNIIVTGSAGFIGSNLCEYLLKKNYSVTGIDNYLTGQKRNTNFLLSLSQNFTFHELDVSNPWPHVELFSPHTHYIFHLASPASVKSFQRLPLQTLKSNSIGLMNALTLADSLNARLIFASTSEIYGSSTISPQNEAYWGNVNPYGERSSYDESKRFGESLIYSWNKINRTKHGIIRIFNTYGPRMHPEDDRAPNAFITHALKNETLYVYGDGKQTRSFCYIDDLIEGIMNYAKSDICYPINLGNDIETPIIELAQIILNLTKSTADIVFKDLPSDDPPKRCPDLSLAKKNISYKPKTSLEEGLKKTVTWLNHINDMK